MRRCAPRRPAVRPPGRGVEHLQPVRRHAQRALADLDRAGEDRRAAAWSSASASEVISTGRVLSCSKPPNGTVAPCADAPAGGARQHQRRQSRPSASIRPSIRCIRRIVYQPHAVFEQKTMRVPVAAAGRGHRQAARRRCAPSVPVAATIALATSPPALQVDVDVRRRRIVAVRSSTAAPPPPDVITLAVESRASPVAASQVDARPVGEVDPPRQRRRSPPASAAPRPARTSAAVKRNRSSPRVMPVKIGLRDPHPAAQRREVAREKTRSPPIRVVARRRRTAPPASPPRPAAARPSGPPRAANSSPGPSAIGSGDAGAQAVVDVQDPRRPLRRLRARSRTAW